MAKNTMLYLVIGVVAILVLTGGNIGKLFGSGTDTQTIVVQGQTGTGTSNAPVISAGCNQNPSYTWSAIDAIQQNISVVTTTNYTKINGNVPVANGNPVYGQPLEFWAENASYFCAPLVIPSAACGNQVAQAKCYANGTSWNQTLWDDDANALLSESETGTNMTLGANGVANLVLNYKSVAKAANMPFGGCLVIEYPPNISTVVVNGEGILDNVACPYQVTYTMGNGSNTYRTWKVPTGFDIAGSGETKEINVQLRGSATNPGGFMFYQWIPANYYVSQAGAFALDIEKTANADSTRVGPAMVRNDWAVS